MVGDGINDSPCFHAAHVSVALDSGTELSKNQADVVLLHNDLQQLQTLIDGARQAHRVVRQNLWWAAGYNLVIIPLAVCGFVSPYVAVIGMSCSSLLVCLIHYGCSNHEYYLRLDPDSYHLCDDWHRSIFLGGAF